MREKGRESVVLAFSGGVDSCYAAQKLVESGYKVKLMMLNLGGDQEEIEKAESEAKQLGLELTVVEMQQEFREKVVEYFAHSYLSGRTPAPCALCNVEIKWRALYQMMLERGADVMATGHYFKVVEEQGVYYVAKAEDSIKDQSYFLWALPQHYLTRAVTPMADVIKSEVMELLPSGRKAKESMGLCFLRGEDYREYLKREHGESIKRGDVVDREGNLVGSHLGVALYTIGQKRGLNFIGSCDSTRKEASRTKKCGTAESKTTMSGGDREWKKMSVVGTDAESNQVVVGGESELYSHNLIISNCVIPNRKRLLESRQISVMIRGYGRNPSGYATVRPYGEGLHITLDQPAWAAAAGQPVVLYEGNLVVGGGILEKYY